MNSGSCKGKELPEGSHTHVGLKKLVDVRPRSAAAARRLLPDGCCMATEKLWGGAMQKGGPRGVAALPEEALAGGGHGAQEAAPGGRAAAGARARGAAAGAQR